MQHRAETESPGKARFRIGVGVMIVVVLVAFGVAIALTALKGSGGQVPLNALSSSPRTTGIPGSTSTKTPSAIFVHVTGAVQRPGLVSISVDSRVVDAIQAAGGFTDDADTSVLNLARLVSDGEQIQVPRPGDAPPVLSSQTGNAGTSASLINLNQATALELEQLPRIGPALAQRIIDWRTAHGRFHSVDDLLQVPGIGAKILDGFASKVTL